MEIWILSIQSMNLRRLWEHPRVRRRDEFLGIGADAVLEARAEGVLRFLKRATFRGNVPFAVF